MARSLLEQVAPLIEQARAIAIAYRQLTGRPLGITGEVGEFEAARLLGLELAPVRAPGFDAVDAAGTRFQIKTRAPSDLTRSQQVPSIKRTENWDVALLVILDQMLQPIGIWRAERAAVLAALDAPGSIGRNVRGALSFSKFKAIGQRAWPLVPAAN